MKINPTKADWCGISEHWAPGEESQVSRGKNPVMSRGLTLDHVTATQNAGRNGVLP